jgi:MFS family permease
MLASTVSAVRAALTLLLFTERGRFSLLSFVMLFQCYAIRVVMSVAIIPIAAEFSYTSSTSGFILSSFFIGYMLLQIPAGTLGAWYGGRNIFTLGILLPSLLTALTPLAAGSVNGLVALRICTGLFEGVSYPALQALMAQWVPAGERSLLMGVIWSGAFVGSALTLPIAGALCASGWGWRSAFYFYALFGVVVAVAFWLLTANRPEDHPRISPEERDFIAAHRAAHAEPAAAAAAKGGAEAAPLLAGEEGEAGAAALSPAPAPAPAPVAVPFLRILMCPPAIACFVGHFGHNWTFYLLLTWLPKYMKDRLGLDLEAVTGLAVIPYLACFVGANVGGIVGDWAIARGVRVLRVRQAAFLVGELVPALALIAAGFTRDIATVLLLLSLALGVSGFSQTGFACTSLDIAPHLAGVIMGMQNTLATIPGIIAPLVAGDIVEGHNDAAHWQEVFYLAGLVAAGGVAVYVTCATDELAPSLQPGYAGPWVCGVGTRGRGAGKGSAGEEEGE